MKYTTSALLQWHWSDWALSRTYEHGEPRKCDWTPERTDAAVRTDRREY